MNLSIILITAAVIGMSIIFVLRINWSLTTLFFLLPFERIGSFTISGHTVRIIQIVGLGAVIAYLVQMVRKHTMPRLDWLFWLLIGFVGSVFITSFYANTARFWENYVSMIFLAAVLFVIAQLTQTTTVRYIRTGLFGGALAASLFGIWQFIGDSLGLSTHVTGLKTQYSHVVFGVARVQSVSTEPLYFANYLLIPIVLGTIFYLHRGIKMKTWEMITVVLCLVGFVLTLSRGAYLVLGLAALLIIGGLVLSQQIQWRRFTVALSVSIVLSAILLVGSAVVAGRHDHSQKSGFAFVKNFFTSSQILKSVSYTDRQNRIRLARQAWQHAPVFGIGLGRAVNDATADYSRALQNLPRRYGYDQVATFNYYWELLAETGIVGFVLMVGFVAVVIGEGIRAWWLAHSSEHKAWLMATAISLLVIFIQAYTFTGFYLTYIWIELGLMIGLILQAKKVRSS